MNLIKDKIPVLGLDIVKRRSSLLQKSQNYIDLKVLKTIPWDLVDIEMISVETDLAGLVMEGSR